MLKHHMDANEAHLLSISEIPANAGHSLHKGTPREAFIKEFLENHLPSNVAIGTGEIIDANSRPNEQRNQFDIVIYKRSYPKLDFGGGISGFLVESVLATIEVKSSLTKKEFGFAARAAHNCKSLTSNVSTGFQVGYIPPAVINIIVAYDGPSQMQTVHGWIPEKYDEFGISDTKIRHEHLRLKTPASAVDAVFVLGKGLLYFDNLPMGFVKSEVRSKHPDINWVFNNSSTGNLLFLFMLIQNAAQSIDGRLLNPAPYLSEYYAENLGFGR